MFDLLMWFGDTRSATQTTSVENSAEFLIKDKNSFSIIT